MDTIRAIETHYAGYRMRSRLEARWAVFFDTLGIKWEYEIEGFNLDGNLYLPDFWLPDHKLWFEVKGIEPNEQEKMLAKKLCFATKRHVIIHWGQIELPTEHISPRSIIFRFPGLREPVSSFLDYIWSECPNCGTIRLTYRGRGYHYTCPNWSNDLNGQAMRFQPNTQKLLTAIFAARSARFGQNGRG
jgi:hypothetical protein